VDIQIKLCSHISKELSLDMQLTVATKEIVMAQLQEIPNSTNIQMALSPTEIKIIR